MKYRLIITLCCSFFIFNINAQEYDISSYEVHDYLGRELIFGKNFLIDSKNHIWITARTHLIKKVGDEYMYYEYNHPFKKEFRHHIVIKEVNENTILGFTSNGVFEFSINEGVFNWIHVHSDKNAYYLANTFLEDDKGNIWVGTSRGDLYHYTSENKLISRNLTALFGKDDNDVFQYHLQKILSNNTLLINKEHKLYILKDDELEFVFDKKEFNSSSRKVISGVVKAKRLSSNRKIISGVVESGHLFPDKESGVYEIEGSTYQYIYLPKINCHVYQAPWRGIFPIKDSKLIKGKDNLFLAHSPDEVFLLSKNENEQIEIHERFGKFPVIKSLHYKGGVIWVNHLSTITKIELKSEMFKNIYLPEKSKSNYASFRSIIKTNKENFYTVIDKEIYKINRGDTIPQKVEYLNKKNINIAFYGLEKHNDSIFIAYGYKRKFIKVNHVKETFEVLNVPSELRLDIKDIKALNENKYLIGTTYGLYYLDYSTDEVQEYLIDDSVDFSEKSINDIYIDKAKNQIWIGTIKDGGLYKKDLNTGKIHYYSTSSEKMTLVNDNINCIYPDPDNTNVLWIGTENGLQKFDTDNNTYQNYLNNSSLRSKLVSVIKTDGVVYAGTYDGLVVIDSMDRIRYYGERDGIPNREFNRKSVFKTGDSVYLGTINGLTMFNPKVLSRVSYEKQSLELIEKYQWDFERNEFVSYYDNLVNNRTIKLSHKKNYLKLKFSVNDIKYPELFQYRYRLDNKKDWINLGNYNVVNLASLEAGHHNLEVQAINKNGEPTNSLKYSIIISEVFYKQGWFFFILACTGLMLFYWYFYEKEKKTTQRYSISLLKSHALLSQMTPHFINNVLNGIQSKIILNDEMAANKYIKSFSNLCKYTLNINTSQFTPLQEEINYLNEFLSISQIKLSNALGYKIQVEDNFCTDNIYIPTMLLQPIIENAIEHGLLKKRGDKELSILFYKKNYKLYVEVEDNGIGRKAASLNQRKQNVSVFKRPHALEILKKRKKILNNMFGINLDYKYQNLYEKDRVAGTKVTLSLNICNKDFSKSHGITI